MNKVTKAEFKEILSNQIELGKCPKCGIGGGDILIRMPWYGKTGVCVKCPYCGHETETYGISKAIFCGKKMATPITQETIIQGILQAVKERQKRRYRMSKLITPTAKQRVPLKVCHLYKCCVNCVHFIGGMTCRRTGKITEATRHCKKFEERG